MDSKSVTFLLLSPFVYSLGMLLEQKLFLISVISSIVFIYLIFKSVKINTSYVYGLVFTFITYVLISCFITFDYDYNGARAVFLDRYYLLPYICVLLAIVDYEYLILNVLNKTILISTLFYIVFFLLNYSELMNLAGSDALRQLKDNTFSLDSISKAFGMCACFLMLLLPVLKNKYKLIILIAFILILASSIFFGRRNMIFTNGLFFIGAVYIYLNNSNVNLIFRIILIISLLFIGIVVIINFSTFLGNTQLVLFENLAARIDLDSRGSVTDSFYKHMNEYPLRWIIGSGLNSVYYCEGLVGGSNFRSVVETGYHHIIFKIGFLGLFIMLCIMYKALRVYKSNILITACSIYIMIYLAEMYPAGVPTFELRHLLAWISVSICLDEKFHALTNDDIKELIN